MKSKPAKQSPGPLLGAHTSTAGGVDKAIDRALAMGCVAMQVFVKNNMQWFATPFAEKEIRAYLDHPRLGELRSVFGHSGYLINLAATNADFHAKSVRSLRDELVRASQLKLPHLVLHPGAHMGAGEEAGLEKVVESIDKILAEIPDVKTRIALETTAGQGSTLGHKFEHLKFILENVKEPGRLCVCLDTAHIFAAGYDISTFEGAGKVFAEFNRIVGFKQLAALHINDSKVPLASHVDRHDHIGKGRIGLEAFRYIMNEPKFAKIPKVLETPKGKDMAEDVVNMKTLRGLIED
ncbi:MAG TPA: deoxyribonuclease IV [Chthoniobacteraceae bacterium]|nr:deoxyribonuclease IV [Chthoniobacteraceae bacterium]